VIVVERVNSCRFGRREVIAEGEKMTTAAAAAAAV